MTAPKEFFMVWKDTGTTNTCCAGGIYTQTGGAANSNGLESVNSGGNQKMFADRSSAGITGTTNILNTAIIGSAVYTTERTALYLNGVEDAANTANWGSPASSYQIGTRNNQFGRYLMGDVAEILAYDGSLTAVQRDQIGTYLGNKYGIAYTTQGNSFEASGDPNPNAAGLEVWLRADAGVNTTPGGASATNGQLVQEWVNQANGAASNALNTGAATGHPTFTALSTGGKPAVTFDGTSDFLNGTLSIGTDKTFFMVWEDTGTTATCCGGGISTRTSGSGNMNGLQSVNSGGTRLPFADLPAAGFAGQTSLLSNPVVGALNYLPGGTAIFINGEVDAFNNSDWGRVGTSYQVGTRNNELGRFLKGNISEILVYDGAVGPVTHIGVNQYLGTKYGIAVSDSADMPISHTGQISTDIQDRPFGDKGRVVAAINLFDSNISSSQMGAATVLGTAFDDIEIQSGTNTFNLLANNSGVTLTTVFDTVEAGGRFQTAVISGTDGAAATTLVRGIHGISVGNDHELTLAGLAPEKDVFVQLFGGDQLWSADLQVTANGDLIGVWQTVADNTQATASTFAFYSTADANGELLIDFDALNVGGAGNANLAGLAGLIVTQVVPTPEPASIASLFFIGLASFGFAGRRCRKRSRVE
jgi:hypothetical protein